MLKTLNFHVRKHVMSSGESDWFMTYQEEYLKDGQTSFSRWTLHYVSNQLGVYHKTRNELLEAFQQFVVSTTNSTFGLDSNLRLVALDQYVANNDPDEELNMTIRFDGQGFSVLIDVIKARDLLALIPF